MASDTRKCKHESGVLLHLNRDRNYTFCVGGGSNFVTFFDIKLSI